MTWGYTTSFSELHEGIRNRWNPVLAIQTVGILRSPVVHSISRRLTVNPLQFLDMISEYTRPRSQPGRSHQSRMHVQIRQFKDYVYLV